ISSGMIADIPPSDTGLETVVSGRLAQFGLKHLPGAAPTEADFAAAADELKRLGCEALAEKPFGVLSQGGRQQELLARARMAGALLLVLDEPCAGMDPGVRERFLAWLNERLKGNIGTTRDAGDLNSRQRVPPLYMLSMPTTVLVTHHIEEV